jgi:citrate lyase subunit beta/citryl-CoA lyase
MIRAPHLRRSWLFVGGADEAALIGASSSGADVLIHELEDFTPPAQRNAARDVAPRVLAAWKAAGVVAAVRVNPMAGDGREDLAAVMRGAPHVVMLPKVAEPVHVAELDEAVTQLEGGLGIESGSTELVPNVELARGLIQTYDIARASPRTTACLVASEDMAADLGAERGKDGEELKYVRARFHVDCVAAGVVSIDCPYTWTDEEGLEAETRHARRLGYVAKSLVQPAHAATINRLLTPSPDELARARRIVAAFEAAQAEGESRVEVDGSMVELPIYMNMRRLLERAAALGVD